MTGVLTVEVQSFYTQQYAMRLLKHTFVLKEERYIKLQNATSISIKTTG
eukprot:CAMPEP_0194580750 /NCGR_PEP_ID=MMETSP0292-20121207/14420_1 /TAXON_ID=39354 /ORGANISM="Heterosigma akashiwo, Strain CCMP2393" /LENGTH=48 /DNA_ID= /DNA_START= /DNA_END= /DNA_ORIENTATION=